KIRTNAMIDAINKDLAMIPTVEFINLNTCLKDEKGGLSDENTLDGLHLNFPAYAKLAEIIKSYI
ncbi:TPA: lipase, partial [Streptococcus pyogenes]